MAKQETNNTENDESISEEQLAGSQESGSEELTDEKIEKILMSFEERLKILELKTGLRTYN